MKQPTLLDVMNQYAQNQRYDIHTALPGKLLFCNGHSATVELMISHVTKEGKVIALPPLVDVPVGFYRGGGFCVTVPVREGDEGLVIFAERCIDGWYVSGKQSQPLDHRFHDLSDAFFLPQGSSQPNKIPNYSSDSLSLQTDDGSTFIRMQSGKIMIKGDIEHQGNYQLTGNALIKGNHSVNGNSESSGGTLKHNGKNIGDTHTHSGVQTGGGNTGGPN
ncbi:TPA: baseplate protein [Providencia stuartii]|uniref:Gp138 family membrane-puncturing spike protein n=1 Tax=Providencia stuartii TaxID=588 RepID=UPI000537D71C|nr:Gp138 family membrane-puncturing spike protein [Providencia stuartii]AXO17765.1 baseplate protein [Providencia stuartii]MBN5591101.1 baseplate protein [Providencia stuartii]HEM6905531.1 baseplate protein [Providencia stuartii]HEM7152333.1 baseplate protein [Providencia stuartii]HEM7521256.1 baseplate protein [Providencia stuartii]